MRVIADTTTRRVGAVVLCLAIAGTLATLGGSAGAISAGSVSPATLSASAQAFQITYSGKDVGTPASPTPNLIVEECIADDTKPGFDPDIDCSILSLQNFSQTPASGTITYGGNPGNPTAPFVGLDPNNGEWSICDPAAAGPGVTNYQSGFLRVADSPSDQVDDFFIPITCEGSAPPSTTTPTTAPVTTTTTAPGETTTTTTTTTPDGGTTTTTIAGETTTTTLGDGTTTTTTTPGDTTTTTTPTGATSGTADDSGGSSGGFGGGSSEALARTGSNPIELVKVALVLLYTGWLLKRSGRPRHDKGMA